MKKLNHLWRALESRPYDCAITAEWQRALNDDWNWTWRLLGPTGALAAVYPKTEPSSASPTPYGVVCHDEDRDDYVGVCPDGTGTITLSRSDLVLLRFDRRQLGCRIAAAMELVPDHQDFDMHPRAWRIGVYMELGKPRAYAYACIPHDAKDVTNLCSWLTLQHAGSFVVLTPTKRFWSAWPENMRGVVLPMDEVLVANDDGTLQALANVTQMLQRGTAPRTDGWYPPDTFIINGVSHQCRFTPEEIAFMQAALKDREIEVHRVMHPSHGLVYKELYDTTKRNRLSQFSLRLNNKLFNARPPIPMQFSLVRGEEYIVRDARPTRPLMTTR